MPDILLNVILAGVLACMSHEGGHWLTALAFGRRLRFRFEWGRLFGVPLIPRGVWFMPDMACWKQKTVAAAGFGTEFACAGSAAALGWFWMLLVASVHLLAYPLYAGEASDFKWL